MKGGYPLKVNRKKEVLGKAPERELAHQGKGKQCCLTVRRDERD